MALALFSPTGAVTEMPFTAPGPTIIAVRLADYVGPARGTLSVVSDSLSVAGDVVLDEQTIAVQTTNATPGTQFADAGLGDSVRVPVADLPLDAAIDYQVFISSRQEGDPPANARSRMTTVTYGNHNGEGVAGFWGWGIQTGSGAGFKSNPRYLARPVVPHYMIYDCGTWFRFTETYLKIRAWGITGGDQTTRFDMLYLVPIQERSPAGDWTSEDFLLDAGWEPPLRYGPNGTLYEDHDNDATSVPWLGKKFSVVGMGVPWLPSSGRADFQEDDDEITLGHVDEFWWDFVGSNPWEVVDPKSSLAYIVGASHVDAFSIVGETFPSFVRRKPSTPATGNWSFTDDALGHPSGEWVYNSSEGWVVVGQHASTTIDAGETFFPFLWTPLVSGIIQYNSGSSGGGRAKIKWGDREYTTSPFWSELPADPRTHHPTIRFRSAIVAAQAKFNSVQEATFSVGTSKMERAASGSPFSSSSHGADTFASLDLDSSGDLTLSLINNYVFTTVAQDVLLDGPVAVGSGYSAGDLWWVKIEQRLYSYRAKAWKDGDTEPDWQVEGVEPVWYSSSGSLVYPWDDNWLGDLAHDTAAVDPVDSDTFSGSRWYVPFVMASVAAGPGMTIDLHAMTCDHDPGSGTLGTVSTKTVHSHTSTVIDDTVSVPYGSHRWVYEPDEKNRHFGGGEEETFDIRVWKASGMPNITPAIVGMVWERRSHHLSTFRPQIYRRILG